MEQKIQELLTAKELAQKLKLSKFHIYRLASKGIIPKVKGLGRSIRFDPDEILVLLRHGKITNER